MDNSLSYGLPSWLREGVYVEYEAAGAYTTDGSLGRLTYRWECINITDDIVFLKVKLSTKRTFTELNVFINSSLMDVYYLNGTYLGKAWLWVSPLTFPLGRNENYVEIGNNKFAVRNITLIINWMNLSVHPAVVSRIIPYEFPTKIGVFTSYLYLFSVEKHIRGVSRSTYIDPTAHQACKNAI